MISDSQAISISLSFFSFRSDCIELDYKEISYLCFCVTFINQENQFQSFPPIFMAFVTAEFLIFQLSILNLMFSSKNNTNDCNLTIVMPMYGTVCLFYFSQVIFQLYALLLCLPPALHKSIHPSLALALDLD